MTESEIQREILDWLMWKGIFAWKHAGQGIRVKGGVRVRGKSGIPDILGMMPDGQFLAIEVKKPGGKVAQHQIDWLAKAKHNNALTLIAYSLADVVEVIEPICKNN